MKDMRSIKDDLSLMQTAYGVALVLGFKNVIESLYALSISMEVSGEIQVIKLMTGILLMLTMIRFFWALGNIRRFIVRNEPKLKNTRRHVVSFHFFILLLHAFVLFSLAKFSQDLTVQSSVDYASSFFVFGYTGFLLFNSLWLMILIRGQNDKYPEKTWIINNIITSVATITIYVVIHILLSNCFYAFLFAFPLLLVNCLFDFIKTSSSYLTIEEEEKMEFPTVKSSETKKPGN